MHSRRKLSRAVRVTALAAVLVGATLAFADPATYGFRGLEIYKLKSGIHGLTDLDADGDGLRDLLVINNAKARLDLFLRRTKPVPPKELSGEPEINEVFDNRFFERKEILTEKNVFATGVGDLDGDSNTDIAYYGKPLELVVAFGDGKGGFGRRRTFDIRDGAQNKPGGLTVGDANGDGRDDLLLLLKTETAILYQGADGTLQAPVKLPNGAKSLDGIGLHDIDGNGRQDLVQVVFASARPLRVRFQLDDGTFGPELAFKLPQMRVIDLQNLDGKPGDEIIAVQATSGLLRVLALSRRPAGAGSGIPLGRVQIHPVQAGGDEKNRTLAVGDVNGDGRTDVVVTEPSMAQIAVHLQSKSGHLGSRSLFPSLSKANAVQVQDLNGDKRAEIIVLSSTEKGVGYSTLDDQGRLPFPGPMPVEGKPKVLAVGDLDADGRADVVVIWEVDKKPNAAFFEQGDDGSLELQRVLPLEGLKGTPEALMLLDLNQDGRTDLLTFDRYDIMRTWVQDEQGGFADVSQSPGYRGGLVDKLLRNAASAGDVDGDGKPELLVASGNFARAVVLDANNGLQVKEQMNGRSPNSQIKSAAALDITGDGKNEIALLDGQDSVVSVLRRGSSGAFEVAASFPLGGFTLVRLIDEDLNGDGRPDLLVVGRRQFGVLYSGGEEMEFEELHSFESPVRNAFLADFAVGDLNGNRGRDLAVADTRNNLVQIVSYEPGKGFTHEIKWRVFEEKLHQGRRGGVRAPREILIADFDGDGKDDLALIVQDRVIVYPQE